MCHVQYLVQRAIYFYLVLFIHSMNKRFRPPLGMKATRANVVDQIPDFKSFPSSPNFSVGTSWPQNCVWHLGITRTKGNPDEEWRFCRNPKRISYSTSYEK